MTSPITAGKVYPTGTVTFLFTDIQGSTPLWEQHPEQMAQALQIHNAALRRAIEANGGAVFKVVGDSFQAAFDTALQALQAAIDGQRALQTASWNELGPLKVRMGLHTGEAQLDPGGDEYAVSHTKNRAARIMSAAYGGQILLSQETRDLVDHQLPGGVRLIDMGEHRLQGMSIPERLYQVVAEGLIQDFPPLATLSLTRHNLPAQLSDFIGRQKEIVGVKQLLTQHRLVTLAGSGGVGKTRLSLAVAEDVMSEFPGGVWFIELATLSNPRQVALAVAGVIGIQEEANQPIQETLCYYFRERTCLLLLDKLLSEQERLLLRRLSVFSGGFILEAAEAICAGECLSGSGLERDEVMDLLAQLVNKSMVILERQPGGETRYQMLETIRQYASEKLHDCGESEVMRNCHLTWYVQLAETIGPGLSTSERLVWTRKFVIEQDIFSAALTWALEDGVDPQAGLRIVYALFMLYLNQTLFSDLQRWLDKGLEEINKGKVINQEFLVATLVHLGLLDATLSKVESALARMDQVLAICDSLQIDSRPIRAFALFTIGRLRALNLGELKPGLSLLNQAESLFRELGIQNQGSGLAWTLVFKSWTLQYLGELDAAQVCAEESWQLTQSMGDTWSGAGLNNLGDIALERKEFARASAYYQHWLSLSQEAGNVGIPPTIYRKLAQVEKGLGNYDQASLYLLKGLAIAEEHSDRLNIYHLLGECCFNEIAWARVQVTGKAAPALPGEQERGHLLRAAHFLGKYRGLMEELHLPVFIEHQQGYAQALIDLPGQLGQLAWETAQKEGREKSVTELLKEIADAPSCFAD